MKEKVLNYFRNFRTLLLIIFTFSSVTIIAQQEYYVSPTGNNTNSGTSPTQPFKTIIHAVGQLNPGDILNVMEGPNGEIYKEEGEINNIPQGISTQYPTIIRAYQNHQPIIGVRDDINILNVNYIFQFKPGPNNYVPRHIILDGLTLDGSVDNQAVPIYGFIKITEDPTPNGEDPEYITIQNCEFKNATRVGILIRETCENITLKNNIMFMVKHCSFWDTTFNPGWCDGVINVFGFYIGSSNNVVENCELFDISSSGIAVFSPSPLNPNNNIIRNNKSYNNGRGIAINDGTNTIVYNNLVWGNAPEQGIYISESANGTKVFNNTLYQNNVGILDNSVSGNHEIYNNIVSSSIGSTGISTTNQNSTQVNNNLVFDDLIFPSGFGSNNITSDPLFIDVSTNNFELSSCSPAIDAGQTITEVTTDFNGTQRPQNNNYDIGAFEFQGGNTFYVATNGNDSNDGSENSPFATISYAVQSLSAGATLLIKSGTYNEDKISNIPPGSDCGPVTIKAYDPNNKPVVITNTGEGVSFLFQGYTPDNGTTWQPQEYIILDGLRIEGNNVNDIFNISHDSSNSNKYGQNITIQNCELIDALNKGIHVGSNSPTNKFINLEISGTSNSGSQGGNGIFVTSSDNLIERCEVYNSANEGIYISGASASNNLIQYNTLYNNTRSGITVSGGTDNKIFNNISRNNTLSGVWLTSAANQTKIYHNTTVSNFYGIALNGGAVSGSQVLNNIAYSNSNTGIRDINSNNATIQDNLSFDNIFQYKPETLNANNIIADPLFIDVSTNNFELSSCSPAIDAGQTITEVTTDFNGTQRPQNNNYDIGAFEYDGTLCSKYSLISSGFEDNESISQETIKIFPNPFNDELNIIPLKKEKVKNLTVFNSLGQPVFRNNFMRNKSSIFKLVNTKNLPKGMYFLTVEYSTGEIEIKKVIKM